MLFLGRARALAFKGAKKMWTYAIEMENPPQIDVQGVDQTVNDGK